MCKARIRRYCSLFGALALALSLNASSAFAFSASFTWCSGSPRFALTDAPSGTAKLDFHMTDLNKPSFHHGGGTVDYRGQSEVPCGAFAKGFVGPSPPPGEVHTYEFTIKALGANGAALATTTVRRKFPEYARPTSQCAIRGVPLPRLNHPDCNKRPKRGRIRPRQALREGLLHGA